MPDPTPNTEATPIEYPHEWSIYRFLFSDGKTQDVRAINDGSHMRGWVLDQVKDRMDVTDKDLRIVGVAELPDD